MRQTIKVNIDYSTAGFMIDIQNGPATLSIINFVNKQDALSTLESLLTETKRAYTDVKNTKTLW